jgi:hypothetical protein
VSIQAVAWALDQYVPDPYQKLILISLANHAGPAGQCFPGLALIAKEASCSRETVMRRLPLLEAAGLITITRNTQGAQRLRNIYRLALPTSVSKTLPPSVQQTLPNTSQHSDRCLPDTRGGAPADTRGGVSADTFKEPSLNRHSTVSTTRTPSRAGSGAAGHPRKLERPEVIQNEIANRLGCGDSATGWMLFGALSASDQDQLTAQHRSRRLTEEAVAAARAKALAGVGQTSNAATVARVSRSPLSREGGAGVRNSIGGIRS